VISEENLGSDFATALEQEQRAAISESLCQWKANEKRLAFAERHLMGFGGSEPTASSSFEFRQLLLATGLCDQPEHLSHFCQRSGAYDIDVGRKLVQVPRRAAHPGGVLRKGTALERQGAQASGSHRTPVECPRKLIHFL
jgi:hypothetical protein